MSPKRFTGLFLLASLLAVAAILLFGQWPLTSVYLSFSWASLAFFLLFTLGLFILAQRAVASQSPTSFIQAVIVALGVKLFGAVLLILFYDRLFEPETRWFLLPFFTLYLIYTILETHLLLRIGKNKRPSAPK